ncbi:MAG: N-acetylneuraminate synthase [Candidatus Doudnabacteria bacterium RIFCSPHIGHO2_01_52_17]|uniref:N-acetylneuraminate synthase n=1 Tax=Candidatus Doudnabacteria bacterium RIFCSPHIGHO2_01_52_17 TaxID=1817820 RepID=A0A1F5NEA8_9BACT|nr:MAG: N-acetylneuraminate synthase [Parcubacteria group bacterium GW2011_GWA2_52_8]OGE75945.1 MAG: N-acetylneuraminate synthase [Candidatus Doudnabacteria bacterium RIFCSPHIGHO2_01_52_17]
MAHRSPIVIAEIGCNHKGDFEIAKEMVRIAKVFCNADAVKFQKRNTRELLTAEEYNAPHPNPVHSYGETYGKHREFLEFDLAKHQELKQFADELGIDYSCSVWDLTSAREIVSLHPKYLKIPSACNLNFELLGYLCENFPGEIHISLGMTSRAEEERIVAFLESKNRNRDTVLYSCVSGYPVPHENVSLLDISRLKSVFGSRVKSIGFSGHHLGIAIDAGAAVLGASHIERHFTLDRTWKGTDHAASLEPDDLRRLVRDVRNIALAVHEKEPEILPIEQVQRKKLKRL